MITLLYDIDIPTENIALILFEFKRIICLELYNITYLIEYFLHEFLDKILE